MLQRYSRLSYEVGDGQRAAALDDDVMRATDVTMNGRRALAGRYDDVGKGRVFALRGSSARVCRSKCDPSFTMQAWESVCCGKGSDIRWPRCRSCVESFVMSQRVAIRVKNACLIAWNSVSA